MEDKRWNRLLEVSKAIGDAGAGRGTLEEAEAAIVRAAAEITGLTAQWAESASGAIEDEFSMETGKPIMAALRRFAELATVLAAEENNP